jgi:Na+-transporting methylmalonyl-CoA/oxaloacetate decarboxylase gamma subunit
VDIANFTFADGLTVSLFGTVIVFLILVLLQLVVMLFRFLPKEREVKKATLPRPGHSPEDDEDELVAMLTASVLAQEDYRGDVRIKSIRRIIEE